MGKHYFIKRSADIRVLKSLFACLLALLVLWLAMPALSRTTGQEGKGILEESLQRMTVQCYALEGRYPPNLEYLEEHYGLRYDEQRFRIDYRIFASNLMPDITVLERQRTEG